MGFFKRAANFVTFGAIDKHEAKKITKNAKNREENIKIEVEEQRKKTQKSLEILGEKKVEIYSTSISDFAEMYEKIGKVSLKPMKDNQDSLMFNEFKQDLVEMKSISSNIKDVALTTGGGALGSAIAAGGAWGLASVVGTASTGTAIGTLSGAAATNATLAWLGGGAISAGGTGMVGGMVVLGGVALAPLAVFTMFMGTQKGKQQLNEAKNYSDKIDVLVEKMRTLIAELFQVQKGVRIVGSTLYSLDDLFQIKLSEMNKVIVRLDERPIHKKFFSDPIKKIFNIDIFSEHEKKIIVETANCASLIKGIIDQPLLNGEGAFIAEAFSFIEEKKLLINEMLSSENLPQIEEGDLSKRKELKKQTDDFQTEMNFAVAMKMEKFGEAICEHLNSYPDLKKISNSKIHPAYEDSNYKQQAGFSAEVKQTARHNADNIIAGKKERIARTESVGAKNHPKYDHVNVDKNNNPIIGSDGEFVGSQQKNFSDISKYKNLYGKDYKKYKDVPIDVPLDQIDKIKEQWKIDRDKLVSQEQKLREMGKIDEAKNIKKKIEKIDDTSGRLRQSKVSYEEAMEARKNPITSVAKDIGKISHQAGVQAAKKGAAMGASVSVVKNTKAYLNGDIDANELIANSSKDTAKSALKSYSNTVITTAVGGALKASNKQVLNNLSKKNGPATIVATGSILAKQTTRLISGKISPEEYAQNIGKEGFSLASSMTGSNMGAIVGTVLFPGVGTIVGGFIGGMAASMLSNSTYNMLMKTINETKMSEEKRKLISEYCKKLKEDEIRYRNEMIETSNKFFEGKEADIRSGFENIAKALENGSNINSGLAEIADAYGIKLSFASTSDLTEHLKSERTLEI